MPTIERHAPGSFCWIELATTNQTAAKVFYHQLLGWNVNDFPMGPGEVYSMFEVGGGSAGAAYTMRKEQREQGVPPHWMIYVAVENADASAQRAGELGGTILAPAFDVMDVGRMAVVRDPTGAVFSLWQAKRHIGLTVTGNNTFCWADLSTPDAEKASAFYTGLFGWRLTLDPADKSGYLHIQNNGVYIGGIPPAASRQPQTPPHWMAWFAVADCDAAAKIAVNEGGKTLYGPMTMEKVGRLAVAADPQGAVFGLITPSR